MNKNIGVVKKRENKEALKIFGEIFEPIIPGIIAAGICSGTVSLIEQFVPEYGKVAMWGIIYNLLSLISASFMSFMPAWVGFSACRRFGGTAIAGGMLGMITGLDGINGISEIIGLYNTAKPESSVLRSGCGGVIAAIFGAWLITKIEMLLRKKMPKSIDIILTPFIAVIAAVVPYILLIMPLTGLVTTWICNILSLVCMSNILPVRILTGYLCAAFFLVAVMFGMQYAFVALYSMQLDTMGYITLFPTLAMAGAGQVGAGLALCFKAKRVGNERFTGKVKAAIIPGIMGVGAPLLYGVTLPLGKPFVTACIGSGFGGAFIMATGVASSGWGASGVLGIPMMGAGTSGVANGMLLYTAGLVISCLMGFVITVLTVKKEELRQV